MEDNSKKQLRKSGRPLKKDPVKFRYTVSFNEEEHGRFLGLFDQSGMQVKAHFITSCIFEKTVKTIQIDKGTVNFYMRLTSFHSQFRSVGVNYNQIVKLLYRHFSVELADLCKKVIEISEEFDREYLKKETKE
jgi:hypothetical protein